MMYFNYINYIMNSIVRGPMHDSESRRPSTGSFRPHEVAAGITPFPGLLVFPTPVYSLQIGRDESQGKTNYNLFFFLSSSLTDYNLSME